MKIEYYAYLGGVRWSKGKAAVWRALFSLARGIKRSHTHIHNSITPKVVHAKVFYELNKHVQTLIELRNKKNFLKKRLRS